MTEEEWLTCENPTPMLPSLGDRVSDRKLRLFACACCRRAWHLFEPHPQFRQCVEFAERYADGEGNKRRLKQLTDECDEYFRQHKGNPSERLPFAQTASAARNLCRSGAKTIWVCPFLGFAVGGTLAADFSAQADLMRDIFGNPFRPASLEPAWLTSDVLALARGIYEEKAFDRMPILADALQDAGCDNEDILTHCRDASVTHVRGCWVVDLVLGKV